MIARADGMAAVTVLPIPKSWSHTFHYVKIEGMDFSGFA